MSKSSAPGFPVEVYIIEPHRIVTRSGVGDPVYSFTFSPDTVNDGIFCDSPGERPHSIAWGISLKPVLKVPSDDYQESALYIETTGPELWHLIECLTDLYNVNFDTRGLLRDE